MQAVFGLRPLSHWDDELRGTMASLSMIQELKYKNLVGSIGVSSGVLHSGSVGTSARNMNYGRKDFIVYGAPVERAKKACCGCSKREMQYSH